MNSSMKGLILSGGKGTRLRPLTFTRSKQLIPIANKPNLFYVVEDLLSAGIHDIGVVISPETGQEITDALEGASFDGARFTFIVQDQPLGLAHAVKVGREFLQETPFVMYLGDNLLSGGIQHVVEPFREGKVDNVILLTPVDNPSQFGVAELDDQGRAVRLIEKPKDPPSNLALVGVYLFSPAVHEVIEQLQPSGRGEYEITDAIQQMIDQGMSVSAQQVRGWWKDTGRPEDLLDANRLILSQLEQKIEGTTARTEIVGQVVVESGATITDSVVRGPVHVASGAVIEHSYVGPYTSVGPDVRITRSEVEYSILLQETCLTDLPRRLDSSVVGQGVSVDGRAGPLKNSLQLVLGDYSQVRL